MPREEATVRPALKPARAADAATDARSRGDLRGAVGSPDRVGGGSVDRGAGGGCGGGSTDTTVATGPPVSGSYVGVTSQGLPISFVVTSGIGQLGQVRLAGQMRRRPGPHQHDRPRRHSDPLRRLLARGPAGNRGDRARRRADRGLDGVGHALAQQGTAFGTNCRASGISWHAKLDTASEGDAV